MLRSVIAVALVLGFAAPAAAQEWAEYVSAKDGFKINFPGQPRIIESTWKSQMDYTLPSRVYTADRGREHYSLTVVDYGGLEPQGIERAKTCPPGNEQCRENAAAVIGPGYWKQDERGAVVYATFKLLQRDVRVTSFSYEWQDLVEGHLLQLTNNADQSRTFAAVAMHEHKLYIVEGTVPKGYPEPGLFQQSLGWVDKDGNGIRYQTPYSNTFHGMGVYPKPPIVGAGGRRSPDGPRPMNRRKLINASVEQVRPTAGSRVGRNSLVIRRSGALWQSHVTLPRTGKVGALGSKRFWG